MRRFIAAALAAPLLLFAACGSGGGEGSGGTAAGSPLGSVSAPAAEVPAFPVTVEHKYGETTIEAEPQRVVSVGFTDQDIVLALGVAPVGVREWFGDHPYAAWPWATAALGDAEPTVLGSGELDFEAVAALDPDLIVGVSSGMTAEQYELLAAMAPTLAQPAEFVDYGTPWQDATLLIGQALGRSERAGTLVADIEQRFAEVRAANPEFDGATAAVTFVFEGSPGAYSSQDVRSRFLVDLGFVIPEQFDSLAGDAFFFTVSQEQVPLLDTDVVAWVSGQPDYGIDDVAAEVPLRSSLAAAAEGREIVADFELGGALGFSSPLSLPYALERMVPELQAAVDGDPSTPVPSVSPTSA